MRNLRILLAIILSINSFYANGQATWQWGKGNTGGAIDSWPVAVDLYGGIYAVGMSCTTNVYFDSIMITYPFGLSSGYPQLTIEKYDISGHVIWAKGIMTGTSQPIAVTTDNLGNVLVLGEFYGHISADTFNLYMDTGFTSQYFVVKMDTGGHVLWAIKSAEAPITGLGFSSTSGGANILSYGGIATDFSGNVYIAASFNAARIIVGLDTIFNRHPSDTSDDIYVARYNTLGNPVWARGIGGSGSDDPYGITVASTGNVYISGTTNSDTIYAGPDTLINNTGVQIALIAAFSPTGNAIWGEEAGGINGAYAAGLASDHSGNVFVTGSFGDTVIVFGHDTVRRTYPAAVPLLALYLIKISDTNNVVWQKTIESPSINIVGFCIARGNTEDGAVWVSGSWSTDSSFISPFIIDSASIDGHIMYTPDSSADPVFLAGYDLSGSVIGYAALQSGADDQNGIACDELNNVYLCADYQCGAGYAYLEVGANRLRSDTSMLSSELQYLAKYGMPTISQVKTVTAESETYTLFPNPITNQLTVQSTGVIESISISDVYGREVYQQEHCANIVTVNMSQLTRGVYFIRINGAYIRKIVKE